MLLIPLRSDTNASDRPSGAQAGLIFFPWSMFRRISIDPLSRWSRAMRSLPNLSASKSVAGLRSVTNAMVFPSGDQDGSRSAYLSFVRRWRSEPSLDPACLRVGEVEVDEERILLAEVGDVASVGRQGGGEMQRALGALLGQQRLGDAARPVVVGELGQVRRLHRVAPLARQVVE